MDPFNTRNLDIDIEDAKTMKKIVDMKMVSIKSLMREVELREKAAQKAKQEVDDCTLEIMAEINDLILEQQRAKEANDKRARDVYAWKANLATEMNALLYRLSDVLTQGDGCLATIDEMHKSLEKRLTSAIKQKESADEEKLLKQTKLAYQRIQMKKLVQESKKIEQQEMRTIKLQEFITDRGHLVNMLQGEISSIYQDVNRLIYELGDYHKTMRPIIPGMLPRKNCVGYKFGKCWANYPEFIREIAMDVLDEEDTHATDEPTSATKPQKFITDYGHLANMSREEMSWKFHDVNLPKEKLDDSEDENLASVVTKDYSMPIIQETIPMQDCEYKCRSVSKKGVNGRIVASRNDKRKNKIIKSRMINSKTKDMKKWILGQIMEAVADYEDIDFA